jgi:type I restriction enzyme S subunit
MTELPQGWAWTSLGDCCLVTLGQSPPGSSYNESGVGMPFFQGKAEFGELRPTIRKWTTQATKTAAEDDVLISVRAPVGPTNLAPCDCAIGRGLASLRPHGGISSRYVLYWLRASQRELASRGTGTTFSAISGAVLREHPIPLAPLVEQRRIVAAIEEHFSRLDAAEQLLSQAKRRVALLRTSARSQAVSGDWPVVALRQVTESQIYGSSAKAGTDPDGVPILRMGNIRDGSLDFDELKYLPADHPDVEKCRLQRGDLLFNRTNSPELVGKSAVFKTGPDPTVFASYLIRVRLSPECDPDWAALVINSHLGRRYVASVRTQQVGQANVNGTKLAAMPIPLPPLDEQRRILDEVARQLSVADAVAAEIDRALGRSAALRRSILERAFSGKLVPQNPSDEPASVLLERIAAERVAKQPTRQKRAAARA